MSGIYIPNMEMPTDCTECWFRKMARHEYLADSLLCPFTGDTTPYLTRDKNCPLGHLPPHGRLIDADALDNTLGIDDRDIYVHWTLEDAPTIIPADPAEEGE